MSIKYKFQDQSKPYFVSFAVVNWIDVFIRQTYQQVMIDSLQYCINNKGLVLYAWCIMPSHVHLIMGTNGTSPMQDILRDLKRHTSTKLKERIFLNPQESRKEWMIKQFQDAGISKSNNHNWQFWQQDNHPIELEGNAMFEQKLNYLHENPVKAGFVEYPEDWLLSSAKDYVGKKGLIDGVAIYIE